MTSKFRALQYRSTPRNKQMYLTTDKQNTLSGPNCNTIDYFNHGTEVNL